MTKKYYRFFWGFLKKQEKWLNEMADKGFRLIRTGRAWYEFEECEPKKYRYAVEFIGEKSKQNAKEYADFLEDCGYKVIFKNLNLDYSVGKAIFRPWAEKGGKIATTAGTFNKELLLVEKVNDGKAFELHTTEDDIKEYQKTVRKPWIFSVVTVVVTLLICFGAIFIANQFNCVNTRSALRVGYVGNETLDAWSGRYTKLDGIMERSIYPNSDVLHIDVETNSGSISIEIRDNDDKIIFNEQNMETSYFDVDVSGNVNVRIKAENHKGSFSIS